MGDEKPSSVDAEAVGIGFRVGYTKVALVCYFSHLAWVPRTAYDACAVATNANAFVALNASQAVLLGTHVK